MLSVDYIAGFFDGEGSIGITGGPHRRTVGQRTWLRISITNTDVAILTAIRQRVGGTLSKGRLLGKGWKEHRELRFLGYEAIEFLKTIQPIVRVKARQVALALEYWEFTHRPDAERYDLVRGGQTTNFSGTRCVKVRKPAVIKRELDFKQRMHKLNKKGSDQP